jgi:hypothetical protein
VAQAPGRIDAQDAVGTIAIPGASSGADGAMPGSGPRWCSVAGSVVMSVLPRITSARERRFVTMLG